MGGRGASSGGQGANSGGGSAVFKLLKNYSKNNPNGNTVGSGQWGSSLNVAPFQTVGDWDDNGNAQLVKWQNQTDDKSANFLARVDKTTDLSLYQQQTNDPYPFYNNPMQKMVAQLNLNKPTTVMSESDFNKYVNQTGATVLFRGWSGQNAVDRFKKSPNSHIGNGINGDGYYFSSDKSIARNYGGKGMKAALSPNARVVSLDAVNKAIANADPKFRSSLRKAGSYGTRTFGSNSGQAQMAIKMGYNTIDAGWAVIPLTKDAVVVSNKNAW